MHLTRPTSSKGRSRPTAVKDPLLQIHSSSSRGQEEDREVRSFSQPSMRQEEVPHIPAAPPQSLNKYKVLPSIERRRSEGSSGGGLDKRISALSFSGHAVPRQQQRHSSDGSPGILSEPPEPPGSSSDTKEAGLLLAVRAPCGRRFQQHFDPSDTLLRVRASAELRFGHSYGEAFIQTMDVPHRSFTDMDMTLAQCGILHRSVLCITLKSEGAEQQE